MRNFLLLGAAGLLGATLTSPAKADAPAPDIRELSATPAPALPVSGTTDLLAQAIADLSAPVRVEADRPTCFGRRATLVGTRGDDVLVGTPGKDVIVARSGNDVVRSRGGVDFVCAGPATIASWAAPTPTTGGLLQLLPAETACPAGKAMIASSMVAAGTPTCSWAGLATTGC